MTTKSEKEAMVKRKQNPQAFMDIRQKALDVALDLHGEAEEVKAAKDNFEACFKELKAQEKTTNEAGLALEKVLEPYLNEKYRIHDADKDG